MITETEIKEKLKQSVTNCFNHYRNENKVFSLFSFTIVLRSFNGNENFTYDHPQFFIQPPFNSLNSNKIDECVGRSINYIKNKFLSLDNVVDIIPDYQNEDFNKNILTPQ